MGGHHGGDVLRRLDVCEEHFWLRQQSIVVQHVCAVRVRGRVTPEAWQDAWLSLHDRHAMLSARIRKEPGEPPVFVSSASRSAFATKPWSGNLDLCTEVAAELNDSLGDGSAGLMRLTVFAGADDAVLLLTAHHSAADGKSSLLVLESLLASATGAPETDAGAVPWLSLSGLLGRPERAPYRRTLASQADRDAETPQPASPALQVSHTSFTAPQTRALRERARDEGTTVHGALVAAVALALASRRRQDDQPAAIRCVSPIDQRVLTGEARATGTPLTFPMLDVPCQPERSLWEVARWVKEELKAHRSREGALKFLERFDQLYATEMTPSRLAALLADAPVAPGVTAPGFMVTNFGASPLRTDYPDLHVVALMTAVNSGDAAMQTISGNTVGGTLGMTQVSRQPMPDLLTKTRAFLLEG